MTTEDYVSFETAKLLKEKGFDWETCAYWDLTTMTKTPKIGMSLTPKNWNYKWNIFSLPVSAPTLQVAMKWLRVHNIIPVILVGGYTVVPFYYWFRIDKNNNGKWEDSVYRDETEHSTYEEACEAAIKYCLENLI